jgi:hypothetical protein
MCRWSTMLLGAAWVLWYATSLVDGRGGIVWSLLQAYQDPTTCEEAGQMALQRVRSQYPLVNHRAQKTVAFSQASAQSPLAWHIYRCLPDTIDPRRPQR